MIRIIFIKQRKTLICCTILFFFLLSIFVFSITYFSHYQLNENKKKELFKSEQQLIDVENAIIYKENDIAEAMLKATQISNDDYVTMTTKLLELSDCRKENSLNNLRKAIKE